MFKSASLTEHLARGVIGAGALVVALLYAHALPWLPFVLLPLSLLALRGCPMCWTVGLVETVAAKLQGRREAARCDCSGDVCRKNSGS